MAERFKATVLKTVVPKGTGGSNPSCSVAFSPRDSVLASVNIGLLPREESHPLVEIFFNEKPMDETGMEERSVIARRVFLLGHK